ncbi:MAG: hypothetical protein ABEH58_06525 [Haloplanus sp.]
MRRRTLLAAAGVAFGTAGCLSSADRGNVAARTERGTTTPASTGTGTPARRYDACPREVIPYEQFPSAVQTEIDAARGGRYMADRVLLREAMYVDRSYVAVDGAYYDPTVTGRDNHEALRLRQVVPKALPDPRSVRVENRRAGERTITLVLVATDGTVLIEKTQSLWPGGAVAFGRTHRVGTHELRLTVADRNGIETETTRSARIDTSSADVRVVIDEAGVSVTGATATPGLSVRRGRLAAPSVRTVSPARGFPWHPRDEPEGVEVFERVPIRQLGELVATLRIAAGSDTPGAGLVALEPDGIVARSDDEPGCVGSDEPVLPERGDAADSDVGPHNVYCDCLPVVRRNGSRTNGNDLR